MSQKEGETIEIGGKKFHMFMMPPKRSHDLLIDVGKMIGPSLGPVLDALFSEAKTEKERLEILDQEIGPTFFTKATATLFSGLDKAVLRNVMDEFARVTFIDNVPLEKIFDEHFRGSLDEMYSWIGWGMKVQWGKSLSVLVKNVIDRGAMMKKLSLLKSPDTSTG